MFSATFSSPVVQAVDASPMLPLWATLVAAGLMSVIAISQRMVKRRESR